MLNKCSEPGRSRGPLPPSHIHSAAFDDLVLPRVPCYGGDAAGIYLSFVKRGGDFALSPSSSISLLVGDPIAVLIIFGPPTTQPRVFPFLLCFVSF